MCGLKGALGGRQRLAAVAAWAGLGLASIAGWVGWVAVWSSIGLMWVPALSFLCAVAILVLLGVRAVRVSKAKASLPGLSVELGLVVEVRVLASEEAGAGEVYSRAASRRKPIAKGRP